MPKSSRTRPTPSSLSASRVAGRRRRLLDQDALGDLEPQVDRVEAGAGEDLGDRGGEVAVGDLARGEVDRDVERALRRGAARATRGPGGRRVSCTQRPIGSIRPLSSAIGTKSPGSSRPRSGWSPAHQRLEAGDLAAAQGDQRLVVERQLVALERLAQLALDLEPAQRPGPHLGVEELAAGAAAFLGPVHRRVGVADQQVGVDRLAGRGPGDGDADAGGDEVLDAVDRVGLGEGGGDAVGDRHRLVLVGEAVDEDAELVAAEAGDDVAGAQVGAQPRRDRAQQLVAGVVAEAVVDQLEVVEVEEEDPDRRAGDGRRASAPRRASRRS